MVLVLHSAQYVGLSTNLQVFSEMGVLHVLKPEAHRAATPEDAVLLVLLGHADNMLYQPGFKACL